MIIEAKDMKSCFNCRFAEAFLIPEYPRDDPCKLDTECSCQSNQWVSLSVNGDCLKWEKKG